MLTESKITIGVAVVGINSFLGVSGHELLKIYLLSLDQSEEVSVLENYEIKTIAPKRKRPKASSFDESSKKPFDPRTPTDADPSTMDRGYARNYHPLFRTKHIDKHKSKLIIWKENKSWWESNYEQRKYMLENQDFSTSDWKFKEGFSKRVIWNLNQEVHINQFCYLMYESSTQYNKYKDVFWLLCSIDGKDPENNNSESSISQAEKANFPTEGSSEQEIIFMTLEQAKKKQSDMERIKVKEKNKFVVYDWKPEWWNWSYQYRLKKDLNDEDNAFPMTEKFKKVISGWDESLNSSTALNKVCKDFYEAEPKQSDETEDAWRYCSATGKKD
ncbi:hypothetical protein MHSWG343_06160 [Candidatus Mycoplasma haematohominis]|uniref:Uncharacterized protein n=1 Tax=Candidatus Mycoplasma haematohominis TaxID=1494318 RepID=A0A478FT14_9MOLU|nr:hypothetical protein MHSWG343_06160 [Candidatus Mycoplasma haemohominis]